jgi:hypothetical protein
MNDPLDRFPTRRGLFAPSPGDVLLENAQIVRLQLMRYTDDEDRPAVSCEYRLTGCVDIAADVTSGELLLGIVQALKAPRRDGGAA